MKKLFLLALMMLAACGQNPKPMTYTGTFAFTRGSLNAGTISLSLVRSGAAFSGSGTYRLEGPLVSEVVFNASLTGSAIEGTFSDMLGVYAASGTFQNGQLDVVLIGSVFDAQFSASLKP